MPRHPRPAAEADGERACRAAAARDSEETGRVLRATVRGASDSRALVAVQARGVELLRRVLLLKARQRAGHTAEDIYVPPEHTYRLAAALAANDVPHAVHVFAHGPHSLGLARGADDVSAWTALAASWIAEYA